MDCHDSATLFDTLSDELQACGVHDQRTLARRLRRLRRRARRGQPVDRGLAALTADVSAARARLEARRANLPRPQFDPALPINQRREMLAAAIRDHQVVVVCGETGSGKTTQLPKLCLELGLGIRGMIGHTQPRRIAARSVANRISEELGSRLGQSVGYKVRFSDRVGPATLVKIMTDGMLLAETQSDPELAAYEVIIVDEAHERSLNIDFLLGYLHRLLPRRPDLKLIITSATIDPTRFARHFGDAPVIEVSGRSYPVEVRYRPLLNSDEDNGERDLQEAVIDAVDELACSDRGDILVFLSGEREIRETAEALRKHRLPHSEVLPLYARLSAAEQNRAFQPHSGRRIVLATNVAETSLTVPGIRYVIDSGRARISRYSPRAKVQRLPIEAISQASAAQRAGRCGRVAPGICIRLYGETDFLSRPKYTEPEILRTNLAAVILQMCALKLGEIDDFPFIDGPERRLISDGYKLLYELGAVDGQRRITELGRRLARLPVDPRLGRMIVAAAEEGSLHEVLVIAAALTIQDPRERPLEQQQVADEKHRRFRDQRSDFQALLNLWNYYHEQARHLSGNRLRRLCKDEFLSATRMREWHDLYQELRIRAAELGMRPDEQPADYPSVHRALLSGLLGQIGRHYEDRVYRGANGRKFQIFPGSGLINNRPLWLMAAELVETTRLYARVVARIEPEWLEEVAPHLIRRHYSEPYWDRQSAQAMARETVTLFGLPIVGDRQVSYGRIDRTVAREIFIREGIVAGGLRSHAAFAEHNRRVIAEISELEARIRRNDLLVDEATLFRFYDARIPADIYNGASFGRWRRKAERVQPRLLFLERDDALLRRPDAEIEQAFPERLELCGLSLPLSYHFEPGSEADGVTLTIPLAALNQVDPNWLEWTVPGLLADRIAALLKTLPKRLRRNFVPVPDFARALAAALRPAPVSLAEAVARRLAEMTGIEVPSSAWDLNALPRHLSMRVRVVDDNGETIACERDLAALQRRFGGQAAASFATGAGANFERPAVHDWDFGDLPEFVEISRVGVRLRGFPALVEEPDSTVALRLLDDSQRARECHRRGVRRLLRRKTRDVARPLIRELPQLQEMSLHFIGVGTQAELLDDLLVAGYDRACFQQCPVPRCRREFLGCLQCARQQLGPETRRLATLVADILARYHRVSRMLNGSLPPNWVDAATDVREQLAELVYPGFISATPDPWIAHLPRYLHAIELRLDKLNRAPDKDRQRRGGILPLWRACLARREHNRARGRHEPAVEEFRWLLEELRVSQFAQELKTTQPVSVKRLEARWHELTVV